MERPVLTNRFVEPLGYAAELHLHQRRKGKGQPYETVCEDGLCDDELPGGKLFPLSGARLAEQAEDFQIEPDERDHQAERAIPFHVLRRSVLDTSLDHVKIENQIQCCDDDHEKAEADSHGATAVDRRNLNVEETTENHFHQIEKRDATGSSDHAEVEALRGANHTGLVSEQHHEERPEGEADGLYRDARVGALEHGGDAAQRQTFEERVDGCGERRPIRLENGNQRDDEAAENAAHHPWNGRSRDWRVRQAPSPCGGGYDAEQEQGRLVDGALQRHPFAESGLAF